MAGPNAMPAPLMPINVLNARPRCSAPTISAAAISRPNIHMFCPMPQTNCVSMSTAKLGEYAAANRHTVAMNAPACMGTLAPKRSTIAPVGMNERNLPACCTVMI